MSRRTGRFQLFRYQILPISRVIQLDFIDGIESLDQLIEEKNKFFAEALKAVRRLHVPRSEVRHVTLVDERNFILLRVAANRSLSVETREFTEEEIENWPSVYVGIWNAPDKQLIAVQFRSEAFQDPATVTRAIIDGLNGHLVRMNLRARWEPQFDRSAFWDVIHDNPGRVQELEFELITPNMANISGMISDEVKEFAKRTNAASANIGIKSDPDAALTVSADEPALADLVNYASEGGGDISIKLKGAKKRIHTSRAVREINIEEMEVIGNDPKKVADVLRSVFN